MPDLCKDIALRIREERKKQHISIERLAEKAGISVAQLGNIEREKSNPHILTLNQIAKALNIPITDLFLKSSTIIEYDRQKFIKKFTELSKKPEIIKQFVKNLVELENLFQ